MVKVSLHKHPLTASAAPVWSGDLPRLLQHMPFQAADSLTTPAPRSPPNRPPSPPAGFAPQPRPGAAAIGLSDKEPGRRRNGRNNEPVSSAACHGAP